MVSRNRRTTTPRMAREWVIVKKNIDALAPGTPQKLDLGTTIAVALGTDFSGLTISAIKGRWAAKSLDATPIGLYEQVFAGIVLVGVEAFAAGGVSLPDPQHDNADWMWWDTLPVQDAKIETAAGAFDHYSFTDFLIDNASMRRVRGSHQELALIISNTGAPANMAVSWAARILVLRN